MRTGHELEEHGAIDGKVSTDTEAHAADQATEANEVGGGTSTDTEDATNKEGAVPGESTT